MSNSVTGNKKSRPRAGRSTDISISDVAERAKVSIGTVSRVFNHHANVNDDLRRRVLMASRTLRFVPKVPHRCMGVIVGRMSPTLPIGYVSVMTSLISRNLAARKYAIELIDIENLDLACQAHIEGVIGIVFDQRIAQLKEIPNLPLLTINNPMTHLGIHSVAADHYQQAVLATEHFLQNGHRDIAMLQIQADEWGSGERLRGYRDTLAKAGIDFNPTLVQYTLGQPVYDTLTRWVKRGVTAILNFSEDASLEVLHFLSNILKLRIGQDISTISLEDVPIYQYFNPPQTTIHQPLEELANTAVSTMLELCKKPSAEHGGGNGDAHNEDLVDIRLSSTLLERDSVVHRRPAE